LNAPGLPTGRSKIGRAETARLDRRRAGPHQPVPVTRRPRAVDVDAVPDYDPRRAEDWAPSGPLLGWRLWRLQGEDLCSWAVDNRWEPGPNRARCLPMGLQGCGSPPGRHCECGFWALWSPLDCLAMARTPLEPPWLVMGVVAGWGMVALHGQEGFRAERASVLCLFTDWPWSARVPGPSENRFLTWWRGSASRRLWSALGVRQDPDPRRLPRLETIASRYGVPLISMAAALRLGVLQEWGVPRRQLREVEAWVAASSAGAAGVP
jgi:hypothetical protein